MATLLDLDKDFPSVSWNNNYGNAQTQKLMEIRCEF